MASQRTKSKTKTALDQPGPRFGDIAEALGLVRPEDIDEALRRQQQGEPTSSSRKRIGDVLVELGKLTDNLVQEVLEEQKEAQKANLRTAEDVATYLEARKQHYRARRAPSPAELADKVAELERNLLTREKVEQIAAAAALDVLKLYEQEMRNALAAFSDVARTLEKREFARKVAEALPSRVCRKELDEIVTDMVHYGFDQAVEDRAAKVFESQLNTPTVVSKLREIAGTSQEVEHASRRLAARLDKIEHEALPERLERMFNEKLRDKLGDVSAETIAAKLDGKVLQRQLMDLAGTTLREMVGTAEFRAILDDSLFQAALRNVVNAPQFKSALDEKFKAMMEYLSREVIPKRIELLRNGDRDHTPGSGAA